MAKCRYLSQEDNIQIGQNIETGQWMIRECNKYGQWQRWQKWYHQVAIFWAQGFMRTAQYKNLIILPDEDNDRIKFRVEND